jgi:hypothetical protein
MTWPNRTIDDITCELRSALKRKFVDILVIGGLLAEAKERTPRGEWLPWLKNEFSMSERSAQKCVEAAGYADKKLTAALTALFAKAAVKPVMVTSVPSPHPPRAGSNRRKGGVT